MSDECHRKALKKLIILSSQGLKCTIKKAYYHTVNSGDKTDNIE